jgi:glycosyltransferase involved in cell wall biosynthesis
MIVKNEERHLSRCLQSVKDIVDEMVIVDTGSTGRTKEIAYSFGAKVFDFEWINDFSAARNYALEKSTSDWNLVLDADEYIINDCGSIIRNFMKKMTK